MKHAHKIGTVVAVTAAAVTVTAGVAVAGTVAPSVQHTRQTFSPDGNPYEIDFAKTTFTIPTFGDSGTFSKSGKKLTFTVKKGPDSGCTEVGTYDRSDTLYEGSYTCTKDGAGEFTVTTDGSVPSPKAHAVVPGFASR